ncbi:FlxA-like family protein [Paenibacillus sp. S-38]|uniref:FlxA-like family protein n=1 Tax=Paenibacillus sp. S-38 TaxID=3416710 RepID=UPI003CFB8A01
MNVSSVSGTSYAAVARAGDTSDLEKQKVRLQAEIKQWQESKEDEKTKTLKISQLELQIEQIERQIAERKAKSQSAQSSSASPSEESGSSSLLKGLYGVNTGSATNPNGSFDVRI